MTTAITRSVCFLITPIGLAYLKPSRRKFIPDSSLPLCWPILNYFPFAAPVDSHLCAFCLPCAPPLSPHSPPPGAWLRHGFHEDGFFTGVLAARRALRRSDIPVEHPTAAVGDFALTPVAGWTTHARFAPVARVFRYPLRTYRWDTRRPPAGYHRLDHFGDASMRIFAPLHGCKHSAKTHSDFIATIMQLS